MQAGFTIATCMASFATPREGPSFSDKEAPSLELPSQYKRLPISRRHPVAAHFDARPAPSNRSASPYDTFVGGWLRMVDGGPVDYCAVIALLDAWSPVAYQRLESRLTMSTILMTVHYRARPLPLTSDHADVPHIVSFRSEAALDGFADESGELWTAQGRLLAESRQVILLVPRG
jgi:acyl-CoA thioesterase